MKSAQDLTGKRFGRLVVLRRSQQNIRSYAAWECVCDCGNYKVLPSISLTSGTTKSCGCLAKESAKEMIRKNCDRTTHGGSNERLYRIYKAMIRRCEYKKDKKYANYGERGIKVCERWRNSYENFREDAIKAGYESNAKFGEFTIDRIDTNGDYCPENCRWVNFKVQQNNRTNNVILTYNGKSQSLMQWSEETGINYGTLHSRVKLGWDAKRILETSPYEYHHRKLQT